MISSPMASQLNGKTPAAPIHRFRGADFFALLATGTVAMSIDSALLRAILGDNTLLAEAAEILARNHHRRSPLPPQRSGRVPFSAARSRSCRRNMKAGGLDAGLFAARGDYPLIRRDAAGRRYESRKPREGELLRRSTEQLDKILEAIKEGKLALARSPAEIVEAKKSGTPCAVLAIEGSDPLEGDLTRVKLFYDRGVRVLQLLHYRINEIGDIQTENPRHNGLTSFGREVVREMNKLGMVIDTAHCSRRNAGRRASGKQSSSDFLAYGRHMLCDRSRAICRIKNCAPSRRRVASSVFGRTCAAAIPLTTF